MTGIRVILVGIPRLLADIVEELVSRQSDIDLVGAIEEGRDLRRAVQQAQPDVILCRASGARLPPAYRELLEAHPHLRVLAIDANARTGSVYDLRPVRTPLDVWPQGLVDAIRSARPSGHPSSWDERAGSR